MDRVSNKRYFSHLKNLFKCTLLLLLLLLLLLYFEYFIIKQYLFINYISHILLFLNQPVSFVTFVNPNYPVVEICYAAVHC